jgi:dihydropteroate synthase
MGRSRPGPGPDILPAMFAWASVCGTRPAVMGIVNVTPDSFSDGGQYLDPDTAVAHGLALVAAGADVLDVGGESTRPGAEPVREDEEQRRVLPVIARLATDAGVPVSVDTSKAAVAAAALDAGAQIVNDVTAGADAEMFDVVASAGAGMVLMHMQGVPRTMQQAPQYDDVVFEVGDFLAARLERARQSGVDAGALCADPGIGFGKGAAHNLTLLARLPELIARLDVPVLVGPSRKTFIARVLGDDLTARDDGTLAAAVWAVDHGARVVRVHDAGAVADALRLLAVMDALDAEAVA